MKDFNVKEFSKIFNQEQKIYGTVNPLKWNAYGNIVQFSIFGHDEIDYIIQDYPHQEYLKELLGRAVEAKGIIKTKDFGEKIIYPREIKIIQDTGHSPLALALDEYPINLPQKDGTHLQDDGLVAS